MELSSQDAQASQDAQERPPLEWREGRRLRAYELSQQGWKQCAIAQALGVTPGAVSQWLRRARDEGVAALKKRASPGAPPKLTQEQKARLPELLLRGAPAFGFAGDVWTGERVAAIIEQEWRVTYHPEYIPRLLQACGWSRQKPVRRARQRNEEAIQEWREQRLPALKKKGGRGRANSALPG
jgi:transposase